ncbi:hypothetical protein FGG44_gp53 [Mycobacterium phage MacnCheese]|uniref:Uncharacterized protein n=1 Tax=Mycobacterium phage MacnCheese TaxID=2927982 RepID=I6XHT5_9CAUD|nr:hypothetical protein FGG44_gp53 [Mycobacterium phage MacnCheese]AFN37744.1 hypothetical protein MACNCHEESE_53 [Mycobacterium phage MacnCheese]
MSFCIAFGAKPPRALADGREIADDCLDCQRPDNTCPGHPLSRKAINL